MKMIDRFRPLLRMLGVLIMTAAIAAPAPAHTGTGGNNEEEYNDIEIYTVVTAYAWAGLCCPDHNAQLTTSVGTTVSSNSWHKYDIYNGASGAQTIRYKRHARVGLRGLDNQGFPVTSIVDQTSNPSLVISWGAGAGSWLSGTAFAGQAVNLSGTGYPIPDYTEAFADMKVTDEWEINTAQRGHSHTITVTDP